jgi:hypothetical protein
MAEEAAEDDDANSNANCAARERPCGLEKKP